jgi:hypothetical protein
MYCWILSVILLVITGIIYKKVYRQKLPAFKSLFEGGDKSEWLLLLVVSSPVILLGLFRALYPDMNYDIFHYEMYLQDFDLRDNSINFAPGAFRSYFFPLCERMSKLFRYVLGYRMGTIFNTVLLLTIIFSIYDFLKKVFAACFPERCFPRIPIALFSLFTIFADNTLFTIGTYKSDLIGVPILLELIHLYFFPSGRPAKFRHAVFFLLGSICIAYKLTFLPYVAVISLFYWIKNRSEFKVKDYLVSCLLLLIFPLIYFLYNLVDTGSPMFPFYNDIFHSSLFPAKRFRDERYGIKEWYELFTFHIATLRNPERCNEWHLYSYRLLMGNFISIIVILVYFVRRRMSLASPLLRLIAHIALLALLFDYACVITTGYFRYGAIVEILYGVILLLLFYGLVERALAILLFFVIFLQCFITFKNTYVTHYNLSWHDYNALMSDGGGIKRNAAMFFRDHGKITDPAGALDKVEGFVNTPPFPEDGLAKILKGSIPIYDLQPDGRTPEMVIEMEKQLRELSGKKTLMSVCSMEAFNIDQIKTLNSKGFLVTKMYDVYPDFMRVGEPVFLLEIKYLDTSAYSIKTTVQYIRDENPPGLTNYFEYNTGNDLKIFVREAAFAYSWDFLPQQYEITINGTKHATNNRFGLSKIMAIEDNKLKIEKLNSVPYFVLIQELEKKK